MSNKLKDFRKRLSVRNQSLTENKLGEVSEDFDLDNLPECEEKIVTKEEDPLKFFSQEQRKKEKQEKEEQRKKYLNPIKEEDDPLHYFEKNKINEKEKEKEKKPSNFEEKKRNIKIDIEDSPVLKPEFKGKNSSSENDISADKDLNLFIDWEYSISEENQKDNIEKEDIILNKLLNN